MSFRNNSWHTHAFIYRIILIFWDNEFNTISILSLIKGIIHNFFTRFSKTFKEGAWPFLISITWLKNGVAWSICKVITAATLWEKLGVISSAPTLVTLYRSSWKYSAMRRNVKPLHTFAFSRKRSKKYIPMRSNGGYW